MRDPAAACDLRFVVVPFLPARQPALGVSSLLAVLRREGLACDIAYLNLDYGMRFGWDLYNYLGNLLPTSFLPGELIFSRALWGEQALPFEEYERRVVDWIARAATGGEETVRELLGQWATHAPKMRAVMAEAPQVVSDWAERLLADRPRVLGFTSTFQQNVAALALAQEVRRRVPSKEVAIVFGGANCEDDMGRALADNFDFIDCAVSGEAEGVIVSVARRLLAAEEVPRFVQGSMVQNMDALPVPDFEHYFAAVRETGFTESTWLTAESSRGCWWGAKSHCTFCGLNGGTMAFRSKSPTRFARELEELSEKYGSVSFALTDNILDMNYLRTFMPELVAQARRYKLFYETKSNLRKDQVELLAAAGVSALQPGIESFSTPVLRLMGKGTTRLQNVQLLKWCAELGMQVIWNLLYGFPGEDPVEYERQVELLPALFHLPAPSGSSKVRLDRFGPYWKAPERYGILNLRHHWSYKFAFAGLSDEQRDRVAYFFEYDYPDGQAPRYARPLEELAARWRMAPKPWPRLELRRQADAVRVLDTRPCRVDEQYALSPAELALLRVLDGYRNRASVREGLRAHGIEIDQQACDALLDELARRRFLIEDNDCVLSLVLDPLERQRVSERQVALRVARMGLRWPQDFPDPVRQQVVRAAMLALGSEAGVGAGAGAA